MREGMNGKPNGTVGTCDAPWISKQSRFSICFSFAVQGWETQGKKSEMKELRSLLADGEGRESENKVKSKFPHKEKEIFTTSTSNFFTRMVWSGVRSRTLWLFVLRTQPLKTPLPHRHQRSPSSLRYDGEIIFFLRASRVEIIISVSSFFISVDVKGQEH